MLPEKFLNRMQSLLGESYPLFLEAIEKEPVRAIRANGIKGLPAEKFLSIFGKASLLSYAEDGFIFTQEHIGKHPLHHAGGFYVQDPGAMATVHALPIQKGWHVADLCAAPGGKSSQLATYVGEEGFLVSNEIDIGRCKVLASNFERLGVSNAIITNMTVEKLAALYPAFFDLVLVDAPCSGEGMFRKYDYAKDEWSEEHVASCALRQKDILSHAAKIVKTGGYLLYSTCTFSCEENEMVMDSFLCEHPDFSVRPISETVVRVTAPGVAFEGCVHADDVHQMRRFYPHIAKGEGQFMCLLQRSGEEKALLSFRDASEALGKTELTCAEAFLRDVLVDADALLSGYALVKQKNNIVLKRKDISLPPCHVYMAGVTLGTCEKGRIEPHHQFFSAFGHLFRRKLALEMNGKEVFRYLKGETLSCDLPNGYGVVSVEGCVLGGIKVVNGIAKNHYPKGLRIKGDI